MPGHKNKLQMKILVAIASYGTQQDHYLQKLLQSYRSMPFDVHIIVLSNLDKQLGPEIELKIGLPTNNPWSLPYGHKQLFADRLNDYDLFIYSEDDMLISERNLRAFVGSCALLRDDEIPGFIRTEFDEQGNEYFCDAFDQWHWEPHSVVERSGQTYASFSNEHSACYMVTREQLKHCIASGGFLIPPHEDRHDLLCAAATDPYIRCGPRRLINLSRFDDFLVPHLSNKYVGVCSLPSLDFRRQVCALLEIQKGSRPATQLFEMETMLPGIRWSKMYYEPARDDELNLVPAGSTQVLSVGTGWGAAEQALRKRGIRVVALPIDSVISACAEARGIEVVHGSFDEALRQLGQQQFDCVLVSNILHLVPEPARVLTSLRRHLAPSANIIATVPNLMKPKVVWGRVRGDRQYAGISDFATSHLHITSHHRVQKWMHSAGYKIDRSVPVLSKRIPTWAAHLPLTSVKAALFASEWITVAAKP